MERMPVILLRWESEVIKPTAPMSGAQLLVVGSSTTLVPGKIIPERDGSVARFIRDGAVTLMGGGVRVPGSEESMTDPVNKRKS